MTFPRYASQRRDVEGKIQMLQRRLKYLETKKKSQENGLFAKLVGKLASKKPSDSYDIEAAADAVVGHEFTEEELNARYNEAMANAAEREAADSEMLRRSREFNNRIAALTEESNRRSAEQASALFENFLDKNPNIADELGIERGGRSK